MLRRTRSMLLALALINPSTVASGVVAAPVGIDNEDTEVVAWPAPLGSATFDACEVARLTPYHDESAVLSWGGSLALAYSPGVYDIIELYPMGMSAFAIQPGGGIGGLDAVVVATSAGLERMSYAVGASPAEFRFAPIADSGRLAGALALVCADLNADSFMDIAGVDSSGLTVRTLLGSGSGFSVGPWFTQTDPLRSLEVLQWTGGFSGLELMVLSDTSLQVYRWSGELLGALPLTDPYALITVVPGSTGESLDRVAVVENKESSNWLSVHGSGGASGAAVNISPLGTVGLDAGDIDGDGDSDIAVSHTSGYYVRVFKNDTTGGPGFDSLDFEDIDTANVTGSFLGNGASPCLEDLNGDGFADLVIGVSVPGSDGLLVWTAPDPDSTRSVCSPFVSYTVNLDNSLNYSVSPPGPPLVVPGRVGVELELENAWGGYSSGPDRHIEVVLWKQLVNISTHVESPALLYGHYLAESTSGFANQTGTLKVGFTIDVESLIDPAEFLDKYFCEVRLVQNPGSPFAKYFASYMCAVTGELTVPTTTPSPPSFLNLTGFSTAAGCAIAEVLVVSAGTSDGGDYVGGLVTFSRLPKLPTGLPQIPAPSFSTAQQP